MDGFVGEAGVGFEVIEGNVDGLAVFEGFEVFDEEFGFEACGVVKIDFFALLEGEKR